MADNRPLRPFIGAESRNTAADYGTVDVSGAVSSAAAINANLADRSNNRLALPMGSLLVGMALIDDNSGETEFPPRGAKSTNGAGVDQTYITSTVSGAFLTRTGGGWEDGGAQD